jgi:hypothetical protein
LNSSRSAPAVCLFHPAAASALEAFPNHRLRPLRVVNFALRRVHFSGIASLQFVVDRRGMHAKPCGDFKRAIPAGVSRLDLLPILKIQIPIISRHVFTPFLLRFIVVCGIKK